MITVVEGLQQQKQQQQVLPSDLKLDISKLRQTITAGRVYQHENFLSEEQVQTMLKEIQMMENDGKFVRKGLSNTALQNQQFSNVYDRSICVVPWFPQALTGDDTREIPTLLNQLRQTLSVTLNRPSLLDNTLQHECYFSKSEIGSKLARHMDERHEELKGSKGWINTSRRSLSWLIYLSSPTNWSLEQNGGALRTYPQQQFYNVLHDVGKEENDEKSSMLHADSTHDGNLQIGWLLPSPTSGGGSSSSSTSSKRVYLDSWYNPGGSTVDPTDDSVLPEYHCILYTTVDNDDDGTNEQRQRRQYITRPFLSDAIQGMTISDFINEFAKVDSAASKTKKDNHQDQTRDPMLFVNSHYATQFTLLEDRNMWETKNDGDNNPVGSYVEDIVPLRGSLVVFDSVTVPHQVEIIKNGTRVALAGWFHESTQSFPDGMML